LPGKKNGPKSRGERLGAKEVVRIGYLVVVGRSEAIIQGQQVVKVGGPRAPVAQDKERGLDLDAFHLRAVEPLLVPPVD